MERQLIDCHTLLGDSKFILKEYYANNEGLSADDFKNTDNSVFDKQTGEEYICGFPVIYQVTSHSNIPSIFRNGFDRAFTGSKAGNMYGPGIYSTYRLSSTEKNVKHGGYGDTFVKMLVLSKFHDFLIFDRTMAKRVHGKMWHPKSQLIHFFGEEDVRKMQRTHLWHRLMSMDGLTANAALTVWQNVASAIGAENNGNSDTYLIKHGCAGFIFKGGHDGYVSVVRDFKNCLPIAYSTDKGKTWKDDVFNQETVDTIFYDVDTRTFLKQDVDKFQDTKKTDSGLNKRINDFILLKRNGKYNFMDIDHNILSPLVDFDAASPIRDNGLSLVAINDPKYVEAAGEPFEGYISKNGVHYEEDPDDYIPWEQFNAWLKKIGF